MEKVVDGNLLTDEENDRMVNAYYYLAGQAETEYLSETYDIYSSDFKAKIIRNEGITGKVTDINDEYFELEYVVTELDVSEYDKVSMYTNYEKYVLRDDTLALSTDLKNYEFESVDKTNKISVDIEVFVNKCIETNQMYASYMGECIPQGTRGI